MTGKRKTATWEAAAVLFIATTFFGVMGSGVLPYSKNHDFLSLFTGGKLLLTEDHGKLYDIGVQTKVQYATSPDIPVFSPFVRPAFSAILYAPFAMLPFNTAFVVWIAAGVGLMFGIWAWACSKFGMEAAVYCAFFSPLCFGILNGQDIAFLLAILCTAYWAGSKNRDVLAGVLLALLLIKFHHFLLLPLVLVNQRRWKMLGGFVAAALCEIAITVAIASPQSYLALLRNPKLEVIDTSRHMMINIHAIFVNFGIDNSFAKIAAAIGVAGLVLLVPRGAPFDRWFWAAIAGGILMSPHTYVYDASFLLIPLLLIIFDEEKREERRLRRYIAVAGCGPLPYFLTLLPQPYSAIPALFVTLVFLTIAHPAWFELRPRSYSRTVNQKPGDLEPVV